MSNIERQDTDIEGKGALLSKEVTVFVLDLSGSMKDPMQGDQRKLDVLKTAVEKYVDARVAAGDTASELGVVVFPRKYVPTSEREDGDDLPQEIRRLCATVVIQPTTLVESVPKKVSTFAATGSSPMGDGMRLARFVLERSANALFRVVVVTDGVADDDERVKAEAKFLAELGVVIDTIGVGRKGSSVHDYDPALLREVAEIGMGTFVEANDVDALVGTFVRIEAERRALVGVGLLLLPEKGSDSAGS